MKTPVLVAVLLSLPPAVLAQQASSAAQFPNQITIDNSIDYGSKEYAAEQANRSIRKAASGACQPSTDLSFDQLVQFRTVDASGPFVAFRYVDGKKVIPYACDPSKNACAPMLLNGLSLSEDDLTAITSVDPDKKDQFKSYLKNGVMYFLYSANYALGITTFIGGEQVSAFIGTLHDKLKDRNDDQQSARETAKQFRTILNGLLSCQDTLNADYPDGTKLVGFLNAMFVHLSRDPKKVDMGLPKPNVQVQKLNAALEKARADAANIDTNAPAIGGTLDMIPLPGPAATSPAPTTP